MEHFYSDTAASLSPTELSDEILCGIGRMVRAAAELEDIVTLYLGACARLPEGKLVIFLGRSPLRTKIEHARAFAKCLGEDELRLFKDTFGSDRFEAAIEFRNTVAHGVMIGITDEGRIAFKTTKQINLEATGLTVEVNSYTPESFAACAADLEAMVAEFAKDLRVTEARRTRGADGLIPHVKSKQGGTSKTR